MERRFDGRVVVITGSGAGIGRIYAKRFASEGANLVIADADEDAAQRVVKELSAEGAGALAVTMNVADEDDAARMAGGAVEAFGRIDILVNNAAIHLHHAQLPYDRASLDQWRRVLDVNVIGALNCTVACREAMGGQGGSVINQSSMAAYSGGGAYGVSKLALNALTVSLAGELASDNIRVNGIAPGLVDSEAAMASMAKEVQERIIEGQLIKRLGRMEDLANMVLFLCSEEASFITGQTFVVDGGFTRKPY